MIAIVLQGDNDAHEQGAKGHSDGADLQDSFEIVANDQGSGDHDGKGVHAHIGGEAHADLGIGTAEEVDDEGQSEPPVSPAEGVQKHTGVKESRVLVGYKRCYICIYIIQIVNLKV